MEYCDSSIPARLGLPTHKTARNLKKYEFDMNRGLMNLFEEIGYDPDKPECPIRDDNDRVGEIGERDFRGIFVNRRRAF